MGTQHQPHPRHDAMSSSVLPRFTEQPLRARHFGAGDTKTVKRGEGPIWKACGRILPTQLVEATREIKSQSGACERREGLLGTEAGVWTPPGPPRMPEEGAFDWAGGGGRPDGRWEWGVGRAGTHAANTLGSSGCSWM